MAQIDANDILSDHQTIDGTVYSTKMQLVGNPDSGENDWGHGGLPRYIAVLSHGAFTLGDTMEIQIQGCIKPDLTDAFIINTTGAIQAADIVRGKLFTIAIPPVFKKYKYIFLKYITATGGESAATHEATLCPTRPVLEVPEDQENTFSAYLTLSAETELVYPMVNQDKETA